MFFNPYNPDFPSAHIKLLGHCCMFFLFLLVYVYLVIIEKKQKTKKKRAKTLLKSERQHLYHIYSSVWREFRMKKPLWVICKILGLFVNPLSANDKYCLLNRGNLLQDFYTQLSQKRKIFSKFFFAFSKFRFSFEISQKRDDPRSWCIFELTDNQKRG